MVGGGGQTHFMVGPGRGPTKSLTLTGDITEILPIVLCELKKLAAAPPVIFYMGKVEAPALRC